MQVTGKDYKKGKCDLFFRGKNVVTYRQLPISMHLYTLYSENHSKVGETAANWLTGPRILLELVSKY